MAGLPIIVHRQQARKFRVQNPVSAIRDYDDSYFILSFVEVFEYFD